MDKLRSLSEYRRATIASATKRASHAEEIAKKHQSALSQKESALKDLQRQVELARQRNALVKDLTRTLSKLDEANRKLAVATEKADHLDEKLQSLLGETEICESKYQKSKKDYNDLVAELENLGIN